MSKPNPQHQAQVRDLLAELADDAVFTSSYGEAFVTLPAHAFHQTLPIHAPRFRDWLAGRYLRREGVPPSEAALSQAIAALRARALFPPQQNVALRVGSSARNSIFIDLANCESEAVEISNDGWRISAFTPGLRFFSTRGQLPLSRPSTPTETPADAPLSDPGILKWALAALQPTGPYPILILHGPPGSGKSTLARVLVNLLDPVTAPLTALPSRERAIYTLAARRHVLAFDHVTRMSESAADALCRISSGIAIETSGGAIADTARPIIITTPRNGLNDWIPRPDLAARSIAVRLDKIDHPVPAPDSSALQAALYTAKSAQLAHPEEPAPPPDPQITIDALYQSSAEADPLFDPLIAFAAGRCEWTGTATDLLNEFPKICVTPRALAHRLRRLTPALTAAGIAIEHHRTHAGVRLITIRALPHTSPPIRTPGPSPLAPSERPAPAIVSINQPATIDLISP